MEKKQNTNLNALKELGLTQNEAKIYLGLIKLGESSALEISKETSVTYGRIYEILRSLEQKQLITVLPGKTKKFIPTNPENLYEIIKEKETKINNLKKNIKELKQIYSFKEEPLIEVIQGRNKFIKFLKTIKETKIDYTIKHDATYHPQLIRNFLTAKKKGTKFKTLTSYREDNKKDVHKWLKHDTNIKQINNDGFAMSIRDDEIFFVLTDSFTIVNIRDKNMIKVLKHMFEETYKSAPKIPKLK